MSKSVYYNFSQKQMSSKPLGLVLFIELLKEESIHGCRSNKSTLVPETNVISAHLVKDFTSPKRMYGTLNIKIEKKYIVVSVTILSKMVCYCVNCLMVKKQYSR